MRTPAHPGVYGAMPTPTYAGTAQPRLQGASALEVVLQTVKSNQVHREKSELGERKTYLHLSTPEQGFVI